MGVTAVVLDTNVLVSAVCLPGSLPADLLRRWFVREYVLIVSEPILRELAEVLRRPKIVKRFGMTDEKAGAFIGILQELAVVQPGKMAIDAVPDDPNDNHVIACAIEGKADIIVSGDRHLQALTQYEAIRILSPFQFSFLLQENRKLPE